jgi:hypothetical protein
MEINHPTVELTGGIEIHSGGVEKDHTYTATRGAT